ncbi:hypothetical protein [uncultured Ramlibacter sp.]|uniref:hypothetical protein n=1 Tax=uncultured Ramlibacter sp. TaxID=260755 RepID=UPI00260E9BC9|nr:hypothetical protein [uncultured Ramlibacter sp.]
MKKTLALAILTACFAGGAFAQDMTCEASAADKKLAGAAKTSHIKKCTADAQAACEASAKDKKLAGAAATSHVKKCTGDKVGKG